MIDILAQMAPSTWADAFADYQAKRAVFDGDQDTDAETDRLCDITFAAQDYLLTEVRTPDVAAFATKIDLMKGRDLGPDEWFDALLADVRHLAGRPQADPHMDWLAERDTVWSEYNSYSNDDDERDGRLSSAGRALESKILEVSATTRDGILAKALLIVGVAANDGTDEAAVKVFAEAKAMGLVEWEA
ncbi:hypothetical protein [Sphingomonas abietis]|uniref:Uncharacterized protein n=1 Tax=Sphingomonas abietis TaxID=3012344 RepID=A0ABY7NMT5_9SPHN|nr:hypothetical protein [Sphingomonas abietis]WBO22295.1 hypothetical protein PBT88_19465 [Sphingomonas abietis]